MEQIYIITESYQYEDYNEIHGAYRSEDEAKRAVLIISKEKKIREENLYIEETELQ